ncbi:glycosyltransferase [Marivirga atlantica]|uniref:Glycosyltransferase family 2 protein n=1 Tax=Marivirga atlantica TaxID=1548457 RepID=A0A937AK43_9BACT|nr:glycosyltransferase family A protein [Marivirga atlantica]MBL0766959.1 glycosyltransferase family 2 protein [Marivirga atlantica]
MENRAPVPLSNIYFERYAYPKRFIKHPIKSDCFLSVVIPAYKEPDIVASLQSLYDCQQTRFPVEIIIVLNYSEKDSDAVNIQTEQSAACLHDYIEANQAEWINTYIIKAYDLPKKQAGVGLARKIGMDEAAYRFNKIDQDGIIVCFDADSKCTTNYLIEIESQFLKAANILGASIHYEHPLQNEHGELNLPIIQYELHLRYYIQALAYTNYPFAFHTIGSSMAVRSSTYQKQGGMNTRKAGEDFYFLHKIIPLGGFINITNATVIPSPRESNRVPFGTGKAISAHNSKEKLLGYTYDFMIFKIIKSFFEQADSENFLDDIPNQIKAFLKENNLAEELEKIKKQSKNQAHFIDRFYQWFNGFKVLKCVHFLRDNFYPDQPIQESCYQLFQQHQALKAIETPTESLGQLIVLRNYERSL